MNDLQSLGYRQVHRSYPTVQGKPLEGVHSPRLQSPQFNPQVVFDRIERLQRRVERVENELLTVLDKLNSINSFSDETRKQPQTLRSPMINNGLPFHKSGDTPRSRLTAHQQKSTYSVFALPPVQKSKSEPLNFKQFQTDERLNSSGVGALRSLDTKWLFAQTLTKSLRDFQGFTRRSSNAHQKHDWILDDMKMRLQKRLSETNFSRV